MNNFKPRNLSELYSILNTENVIIHANGSFLQHKYKNITPKPYVFLDGISELKDINFINPNTVSISCLVAVEALISFDFIPNSIKEVSKLLNQKSSLGGLICNTSSWSKMLPILYAYNVYLELASINGSRYLPIDEFYKEDKTVLKKEEFLKNIILPLPNINNFIYISLNEIDLFILYKVENNRVKDIRICFFIDAIIRSKFVENVIIGSDYAELEHKFDLIINYYIHDLSLANKNSKANSLKILLKKELFKIF